MLDPSLHPFAGAGASAFAARRDFAGPLLGERMDHPAARIPACQTSVRSACPYTKLLAIAPSPGLTWAHGRIRGADLAYEGCRGARGRHGSTAACAGRGAGRVRAFPAVRALAVAAHGPRLRRRHQIAAR